MYNETAALSFKKIKSPIYSYGMYVPVDVCVFYLFAVCVDLQRWPVTRQYYPKPPADGAHSVQNMALIRFQTSFMRHQLFQPRSSSYRCLETSTSALPDQIRASENLFYTLAHKGCSPSIKWSWLSPFDWRSSSSASPTTDERLIWVG